MATFLSTIVAIIVAVFITVIGRLVATHTGERYYHTTPLHCFIAGLGIWYIWFLLFSRIGGVSLDITAGLFIISASCLFFVLPKVFHIKLEMEHFWTLMVASLIVLIPTFILMGGDEPTFWREFMTDIKLADYLFWLNGLPNQLQVNNYALNGIESPIGLSIAISPIFVILQKFTPAVFAVWSLFLLSVVAGGLTRSAGIDVRWSNLPIVTGGSLIAITVLNPFFNVGALFSSYIELWVAATLFCAMMPLFSNKPLPQGWEVIPTAFVLAFLVGLVPEGIYLAIIIILLWVVRMVVEDRSGSVANLFALTSIITIPAIAFYLWYGKTFAIAVDTNLPEVITSQLNYYIVLIVGSLIGILSVWYSMKSLFNANCSKRSIFVENAWYVLPAIVFIIGVATSFYFSGYWGIKYTLYTQFILLLPVWIFFTKIYQNMWIHKLAYSSPWGVGLFLILIVVGAQFSYKNKLNSNQQYALNHVKQVGYHLVNNNKLEATRIAVLDGYNPSFYADALAFSMGHKLNKALPINDLSNMSKNSLHKTLKENNIKNMWIHQVTPQIEEVLGVKLERGKSYFFKVNDYSFELTGIYPHPNYR